MNTFGAKSVEDLKESADRRLRQFLRGQIQSYHPHYRRRFEEEGVDVEAVSGVADLVRLPFTTKADLLPTPEAPERARDFILQPTEDLLRAYAPLHQKAALAIDRLMGGPERARSRVEREYKPIFMTATTGRSARPTPFLYTLHDIEILKLVGCRLLDIMDQPASSNTVNLFPYAPHLAFWQVQMAGFAHGVMVVGTGGGRITGTEASIQLIERMKAETIVGVPSFLYHVLRRAVRIGAELPHVKLVVLGAERVPDGMKEKMLDALGRLGATDVKVIGTYGFTEARMAFCEDPNAERGGYVLYPDLGVFEIVDPETDEVLPDDADGELVYTPFDGRGTVVLRYRTGDLVKGGIRYENVPRLGGWVPILSPDISRVSNIHQMDLKKVKGTLVNLNDLATLLSDLPEIEEWQVEIRKKDDDPYEVDVLVVVLALKEGKQVDVAEFREHLRRTIQMRCEVQPNEVLIEPLDELIRRIGLETEMKEKRIVDLRPPR